LPAVGDAAAAREKQKALVKPCQQQVVKAQLVIANDYRADVQVAKHCKGDAERLCAGVKDGGGRVQACLVSACVQLGVAQLLGCVKAVHRQTEDCVRQCASTAQS
jgi:Golgi apparatus protein 1